MEKLEMKLVRPFGPSVIHAKIPVNTVEMLNKYIDGIVADKKKSSSLDHVVLTQHYEGFAAPWYTTATTTTSYDKIT